MHPGLEAPEYFHDFHTSLIVDIRYALSPKLPDGYEMSVERNLSMTNDFGETKHYAPDARIDLTERPGGTATAVLPDLSPEFVLEAPTKPQRLLTIRDDTGTLITTIEILSPANKRGDGYDDFRRKQSDLAAHGVHLVELDLLRKGKRRWRGERAESVDYLMTVQREGGQRVLAWSATVGGALPTIPIPLRYPDGDLALALEEVVKNYLVKSGVGKRLATSD